MTEKLSKTDRRRMKRLVARSHEEADRPSDTLAVAKMRRELRKEAGGLDRLLDKLRQSRPSKKTTVARARDMKRKRALRQGEQKLFIPKPPKQRGENRE